MARDMDFCQSLKSVQSCLKNAPKTLIHGKPPQDMVSAKDEYYLISIHHAICEKKCLYSHSNYKEYIDKALSIAMHAMRAAIHSIKTRHLRETQHEKCYTVQRAHSHIITDEQTTG